MTQKTKLMPFLLIGISLTAIVTYSCIKKDYQLKSKYYFINETNTSIIYQDELSRFNINPNDTVVELINTEGPKEVSCGDFTSPLFGFSPCIIKYDNVKCDTFYSDDNRGPVNIDNYECTKLGERDFEYIFRFTQDLLNEAKELK